MLGAGQTAYVRAGTYEEALNGPCGEAYNSLSWNASGTAAAPITLSGYPGEERQVVVKTRLKLNGSWLRLRNLIVERNHSYSPTDSSCTGHTNVAVYGDDDEVSGLEVRHANMSGILVGSGGVDRVQIVGNWIHDNGTHTNLDHGVYWSSGTGGLLANNLIERSQAYGVQMYPAPSGQTIMENTIVASGYSRAGILLNTTGSGIAVVNNVSAFNTGPGIRVSGSGCTGCFADQNLLFGNSVDYDGGSGITIYRTIRLDPRFVDRNAGNYHLQAGSPALDVARVDYSLEVDLDGRGRPQGPAPDLGALER
jgi:Right handed beta helix region